MNDLLSYLHVARELLLVCRLPPGPPAEANQQTLVLADLLQSTMTTWSLIMQWASQVIIAADLNLSRCSHLNLMRHCYYVFDLLHSVERVAHHCN